MRQWNAGQVAEVRTPAYVRDDVHVDLLASAYAAFVDRVAASPGFRGPTRRLWKRERLRRAFRRGSGQRTALASAYRPQQTDFSEPLVRINTERVPIPAWNEAAAWDAIARYYGL